MQLNWRILFPFVCHENMVLRPFIMALENNNNRNECFHSSLYASHYYIGSLSWSFQLVACFKHRDRLDTQHSLLIVAAFCQWSVWSGQYTLLKIFRGFTFLVPCPPVSVFQTYPLPTTLPKNLSMFSDVASLLILSDFLALTFISIKEYMKH